MMMMMMIIMLLVKMIMMIMLLMIIMIVMIVMIIMIIMIMKMTMIIGDFSIFMGVSKFMVFLVENSKRKWMRTGGSPMTRETSTWGFLGKNVGDLQQL